MKQYLKNLFTALCGNNPYQAELEEVKKDYAETAERVKKLEQLHEQLQAKTNGNQTLIENLRKRIAEKDELIKRTKKEYQEQIEKYNKVINDLRVKQSQKPAKARRKPRQKKDE